jgi:spore germination protein GerM
VSFSSPSGPTGGLLAHNDSGVEGLVDFAVVPVTFAGGGATGTAVQVFYTANGGGVVAFTRTVPKTTGVLKAAVEQELLGPQAAERGVTSFFSADTAGMLAGVSIANGVAVVDFDPALATTIPNASSSAGSQKLIAELDATVFQFPSVNAVEYRLGGSCDAFWSWLQGQCRQETR